MEIDENTLTKSDFEEANWQEVIQVCDEKECASYSREFYKKLDEVREQNNIKGEAIYSLLANITSLHLDIQSPNQPFKPKIVLSNSRSVSLDDISNEQLNILAELIPVIEDPEMKARVADVIWVRKLKHNYKIAGIASEAYIRSFENLLDPDLWPPCVERIERALQLAALLGKTNKYYSEVIQSIENTLADCNGEDPSFLSHRLMKLLVEQKKGSARKYIEISKKLAEKAEGKNDWDRARHYWDIKSEWHALNKEPENKRNALITRAETYVKESEEKLKSNTSNYIIASSLVENAIEAYRRIVNTKERVEELHKVLIGYQEKSVGEMVKITSDPIDITNIVEEARNEIKGKDFIEALFLLARSGSSPKYEKLKQNIKDSLPNYILKHLFSAVTVNEVGKVVGRQTNMISEDPKEFEASIKVEMYQNANYHRLLQATAIVKPSINQILLEHDVREQDFLKIVVDNPFVPPSREGIYAKGLYAGLTGDLMVSTHLLIPQLEHSIRYILFQQGVIPSTYNSDGIQDERNLNSLLFLPELEKILGEDLVFDLQGLLVERFGANLRNKMAHGLMNFNDFHEDQGLYLWWITLRICCLYKIANVKVEKMHEG